MTKKPSKGKSTTTRRRDRPISDSSPTSSAIVVSQPTLALPSSAGRSLAPTFKNLVENIDKVRRFIAHHLNMDYQRKKAEFEKLNAGNPLTPAQQAQLADLEIDWGTIPGVDKPFLKQPGAEKTLLWLHCYPAYHEVATELVDGHLEMVSKVLIHSKQTREVLFEGPACSCSTMESNYRFRFIERELKPSNEEAQDLKRRGLGKWKKKKVFKGGKFMGEEFVWVDRVENPNIHDERNKVRQIGQKRSLVKAVRGLGAMSEIFTAGPDEWNMEGDDDVDPYLHDKDYTEGGRKIVVNGRTPSGAPVSHEAWVEDRGEPMPVGVEYDPSIPVVGPNRQPYPSQPGNVSLVCQIPSDASEVAHVSGLVDVATESFILTRCAGAYYQNKKVWGMPVASVEILRAYCTNNKYKFIEPGKNPPPPATTEARATAPAAQQEPPRASTVSRVRSGVTKDGKGNPYVEVTWGVLTLSCFSKDLFPYLEGAVGKECEFSTKSSTKGYYSITSIKRIGDREFEVVEGKCVPVRTPNDLPGQGATR